MTSPANWERVFDVLPSKNLGLALDPSHFVWQMIDCAAAIRDFSDKIFHVHFKDIKLKPEELARRGTMAYPLDIMEPFVSQLTMVGYEGDACIEVEDASFEGSRERLVKSIELSKRYLEQFVI